MIDDTDVEPEAWAILQGVAMQIGIPVNDFCRPKTKPTKGSMAARARLVAWRALSGVLREDGARRWSDAQLAAWTGSHKTTVNSGLGGGSSYAARKRRKAAKLTVES